MESHEAIKSVPYNGLSESFFERVYANSDGAFRVIPKVKLHFIYMQEQKRKIRNLVAQVL